MRNKNLLIATVVLGLIALAAVQLTREAPVAVAGKQPLVTATLLDGRALAGRIEDSLRAEVQVFTDMFRRRPRLVVVLVGLRIVLQRQASVVVFDPHESHRNTFMRRSA